MSQTPLTRRQAIARLGMAAGCLAAAPAWAAQANRPQRAAPPVKGAQLLLEQLEEDRQAQRLPSESDSPTLLQLRRQYEALPHQLEKVRTIREGHVVELAVEKRGNPASDRVVVMVHGLLADRETWMYVTGALGGDHQLWLIDLPGCGSSECPHPSRLEEDAFSPAGMADRVLQVIAHCVREREVKDRRATQLIVVGHSLGGTVCLRMTGDQTVRRRHASTLARIQAMVLFAPADVAINTEISSFMTVLGLTGVKIRLGQVLGMVKGKTRTITREAYHVRPCATREQAERFTHALTNMGHLRAAQAMIRNAVPWRVDEHRPDWPGIKRVEAGYARVDVPCVIAWGEWDETLSECMGHKIRDKIPTARLVEIEGAGHCLPSEVPCRCAQIIETTETLLQHESLETIPPVVQYGIDPFQVDEGIVPMALLSHQATPQMTVSVN